MEDAQRSPSFLKRLLALAVLVVLGFLVLKLVLGFLTSVVFTVFWIAVAVALVAALVWAVRTL